MNHMITSKLAKKKVKKKTVFAKKPVTQKLLKKIKNQIVKAVHPEKIILFGSWARREATKDSDLDLMVIERKAFNKKHSKRRNLAKLWLTLADVPIPTDIVLYSQEEVEHWKHSINHLVFRALKEGKVLYEKP
ncbi:MAG: nucleotidyltransferase domain-containing protein [Gammaproteobacteria bacterium]|nr:nucleotidyltransferase domain-containing protein [Gammaproteobacteria bacterium]